MLLDSPSQGITPQQRTIPSTIPSTIPKILVGWYEPTQLSAHVVLWLSDGEWTSENWESDSSICSQICRETGVYVVNICCRAQEWSTHLRELLAVVEWALGEFSSSCYIIAGFSSGTHRIMALLNRLYNPELVNRLYNPELETPAVVMPAAVQLVAPVFRIDEGSYWRRKPVPKDDGNLTQNRLNHLIEYFKDSNAQDPIVNPYRTSVKVLRAVPMIYVARLSYDILTEDTEETTDIWRAASVKVSSKLYHGPHHLLRGGGRKEDNQRLCEDIVCNIRRHLVPSCSRRPLGDLRSTSIVE